MEKIISQHEYEKFYDDVIRIVEKAEETHHRHSQVLYLEEDDILLDYIDFGSCNSYITSSFLDKVDYPQNDRINLDNRKYGSFIDNNYKTEIINTIKSKDENKIEELKKEIAGVIRRRFL